MNKKFKILSNLILWPLTISFNSLVDISNNKAFAVKRVTYNAEWSLKRSNLIDERDKLKVELNICEQNRDLVASYIQQSKIIYKYLYDRIKEVDKKLSSNNSRLSMFGSDDLLKQYERWAEDFECGVIKHIQDHYISTGGVQYIRFNIQMLSWLELCVAESTLVKECSKILNCDPILQANFIMKCCLGENLSIVRQRNEAVWYYVGSGSDNIVRHLSHFILGWAKSTISLFFALDLNEQAVLNSEKEDLMKRIFKNQHEIVTYSNYITEQNKQIEHLLGKIDEKNKEIIQIDNDEKIVV